MKEFLKEHWVWRILVAIVVVHGWVIFNLKFFPYPELFVYPYLTNQGLIPYKEIWDQHFPGLLFLPVNFDNLGMTTPVAARWWLVGTVGLTHLALFAVGKRLWGNGKRALVGNLFYFLWQPYFEGYVLWIDSFLPIFLLWGLYFLLGKRVGRRELLISGLILGVGVVFKQILLPPALLVGLYIIVRRGVGEGMVWGVGVILPVVLMLGWWWRQGVLSDFWFWTVRFNLTTFAAWGRKLPTAGQLMRLGTPVAVGGLIYFRWWGKKLLGIVDDKWFLVGLFFVGGLAAIAARFDFIHFQPSLPFMVLMWGEGVVALRRWGWVWLVVAVVLIWLVPFYGVMWGKEVWFFDKETHRVAERIEELTDPSEEIFVLGASAHLYQMSRTLPAGRVFVFQFPWFMRERQGQVLEALQRSGPKWVVVDWEARVANQGIEAYASQLAGYVRRNYERSQVVGGVEFWERRGG